MKYISFIFVIYYISSPVFGAEKCFDAKPFECLATERLDLNTFAALCIQEIPRVYNIIHFKTEKWRDWSRDGIDIRMKFKESKLIQLRSMQLVTAHVYEECK